MSNGYPCFFLSFFLSLQNNKMLPFHLQQAMCKQNLTTILFGSQFRKE
jgi:hypothetical protein